MILPEPRAYVDWTVPNDAKGEPIGSCSDEETYNFYIEWLADYLYVTDIPVPANQQAFLEKCQAKDGIHTAVFWASESWGSSIWDAEGINQNYLDGTSYEDFHANEVDVWNDMSEDDHADYENPDEEFFISEAEYNRIGNEALDARKVPGHIKHADIGYRAVFASLLKQVDDKSQRVDHLKYFYNNLNECALK
ncbi:hypothetical protein P0Y35_17855 [Kiritimatiellaeota bacterium B1221]|nr:hypothetical protein [Kiritimatiellaeota bacterium B1221]